MNQSRGNGNSSTVTKNREKMLHESIEGVIAKSNNKDEISQSFESYDKYMRGGGYFDAIRAVEPQLTESEVADLDQGNPPPWAVEGFRNFEQEHYGKTSNFF